MYTKDITEHAPAGKWALSLPSDDNKLRRKWYSRNAQGTREPLPTRPAPASASGALALPGGRGELVRGGLGSTLRWRPKYRYAHGYPRQDGPHWLGGYDDISRPPKMGADSKSGKGLPGVNVYDWSVDKTLARSRQYPSVEYDDKSSLMGTLEQDAELAERDAASYLWPPIVPQKRPTQLKDTPNPVDQW